MDKDLPEDTIIDLSIPGIVHYIHPNGRPVNPKMMDPNIGGYHGKAKENSLEMDKDQG